MLKFLNKNNQIVDLFVISAEEIPGYFQQLKQLYGGCLYHSPVLKNRMLESKTMRSIFDEDAQAILLKRRNDKMTEQLNWSLSKMHVKSSLLSDFDFLMHISKQHHAFP